MGGDGMDLWDTTASASHERIRMPQPTIMKFWASLMREALVVVLVELQPLMRHREELTLDSIRLADLGATEVDDSEEIDLAIFYALQPFDSFGGNILGTAGFSLLEARSRRQGDLLVHRVNGDDNPRTDHGSQAVSGGLQGVFQ